MASNQERRRAAKRRLERQLERRAARARRRRTITIGSTVGVVIVVVLGIFLLTRPSGPAASAPPSPAASPAAAPPPNTTSGPCRYAATPDQPAAKPVALPPDPSPTPAQGSAQATLKTNQGDIPLTLNRVEAPCTVQSFLHLAQAKYFDNTNCHRLVTGNGLQVLQCGDPTGTGMGGPGYQFKDEVKPNASYTRGTLAMANSGPNTNGSQFFMVYGDSQLPPNYTVFGTIGQPGLAVLDKVAKAGSDNSSSQGDGKPKTPVTISQAVIAS